MVVFPSRRRHASLQGDWSSDVCSSDLLPEADVAILGVSQPISSCDISEPFLTTLRALAAYTIPKIDVLVSANIRSVPNANLGADRKSTRLNSSHLVISYAVFCLKKKNN